MSVSENTKSKESQTNNPQMVRIGVEFILKQCIYIGYCEDLQTRIIICNQIGTMNQNLELVYQEEKTLKKLDKSNQNRKIYKLVQSVIQIFQKGDERLKSQIYHYQVFPKLGPSLKLCFQFMCQSFKIQTICLIAIQMLTILEKIHSNLIVHRNLKPKKILTQPISDSSNKNELHLIDFRYASKFKRKNGKFFSFSEDKKFQNKQFVNKFSSVNTHLGLACSPKDDLESLGYILVYFLRKGNLVPQEGKNKEDIFKNVQEYKINMICEKQFKDLPNEINQYFYFVKMTNIDQYPFPDYEFLKKIFKNLIQRNSHNDKDMQYEWINRILNVNDLPHKEPSEMVVEKQEQMQKSYQKILSSQNTVGLMDSENELDDTLEFRMTEINSFQARFKDTLNFTQ